MPAPGSGEVAARLSADLRELPVRDAKHCRQVRRRYSRQLKDQPGDYVLAVGLALVHQQRLRWVGCELVRYHGGAFGLVGEAELEEFGRGINSWGSVDAFARLLSGPAWLHRQIPDETVYEWARSPNRWWRRAALVSTVALNVRSHGGTGDVSRTLAVCEMLIDDRDDMVVKAMSWALRELVVHDPDAVRTFLEEENGALAARVKREVRNKLDTGLKNPGSAAKVR